MADKKVKMTDDQTRKLLTQVEKGESVEWNSYYDEIVDKGGSVEIAAEIAWVRFKLNHPEFQIVF